MDLDDGLDELLADINEPSCATKSKTDVLELTQPGAVNDSEKKGADTESEPKPGTSKGHCVLVNQKQRGNPLLKFITSVPWEYDDIVPDYEISKTIGILFLSVRYHNLNPDYIHNRLKELGKKYELRVLLVQRGNPLLKFITSVPWEYDDIVPDYEISKTIGILFLSVRYHNLNPDYIHNRLKELGKKYELRVLLVQVDLKDPHAVLKNLTRICLLTDLTLMLAWSPEESGRIIENYKIFENKPPDKIMEKIENDPHQKIVNALSSIKPVNKTDAMTLISTFGSLGNIIKATERRLADCPGFGATKAKKLHKALHEPFLKKGIITSKEDDNFAGDLSIEDVERIETENETSNKDL